MAQTVRMQIGPQADERHTIMPVPRAIIAGRNA